MLKMAVLMDPIESITPHKDTSLAMLLEAQHRQYDNWIFGVNDLWVDQGIAYAHCQQVKVQDNNNNWHQITQTKTHNLGDFDVILMRKDPPFDMQYIYLTYILELAEQQGAKVINKPSSLRDANEKCFTSWFPQCCPDNIISNNLTIILDFVAQHQQAIIKPLDGMGGKGIIPLQHDDPQLTKHINTVTANQTQFTMTQKFIPEIEQGDKRIIMINGEAAPYGLARIPKAGDFRGNLVAGATGIGFELSERDHWIAQQVGPTLKAKGLLFVGLDVIGDYLTEINVTSPTCVREINRAFDCNLLSGFFDLIERLCQ
jgi:glutathione synthase